MGPLNLTTLYKALFNEHCGKPEKYYFLAPFLLKKRSLLRYLAEIIEKMVVK